jgi:hypothetical protein
LPGAPAGLFRFFAFGDVLAGGGNAGVTVIDVNRGHGKQHVTYCPVFTYEAGFDFCPARLPERGIEGLANVVVFLLSGIELAHMHEDEFVGLIAGDFAYPFVDGIKMPLTNDGQSDGRNTKQALQFIPAQTQGLFVEFLLGNILHRNGGADLRIGGVDGGGKEGQVAHRTVLADAICLDTTNLTVVPHASRQLPLDPLELLFALKETAG